MISKPSAQSQRPQSLLDDAKISPSSVYDHPQQVVQSHVLTAQQKADILEQWETDAIALQKAAGEGMTGDAPSRLDDVHKAQSELREVTAGRAAQSAAGTRGRSSEPDAPSPYRGIELLAAETERKALAGKNVRNAFVVGLVVVIVVLLMLGRFLAAF